MAVTRESPVPYAPASGIVDFINKYRNHGLTAPFDSAVLARIGISESLIPRTLQALQTLDLITDEGRATATLEKLGLTATAEYKERMAEWIRTVYAEIFQFTDPAGGNPVAIRDAFRTYNPRAQQPRMVSLFIGLCKEAGIIKEMQQAPRSGKSTNTSAGKARPFKKSEPSGATPPISFPSTNDLPPALLGLLQDLPTKAKGWNQAQRSAFHNMLTSLLDYYFPVQVGTDTVGQEVQGD